MVEDDPYCPEILHIDLIDELMRARLKWRATAARYAVPDENFVPDVCDRIPGGRAKRAKRYCEPAKGAVRAGLAFTGISRAAPLAGSARTHRS